MKKWKLSNISDNRSMLFGVATIVILLFHSTDLNFSAVISSPKLCEWLNYLRNICNGGVDFFFILSGIGLWFSFSKDSRIGSFYKKRAMRVLPSLIVFSTITYGFCWAITGKNFFLNLLGLGLIFDGKWFLTLLFACYIVFPFLYKLLKKTDWIGMLGVIAVVILFNAFMRINHPTFYNTYEIALTRIPSFVVGTYLGKKIYENKTVPMFFGWLSIILFVGLVVFMFYFDFDGCGFLRRYMRAILFFLFMFMTAFLASLFKKNDGPIRRFFKWLGGYSFEIYILYEALANCLFPKMVIDDASNISKYFVIFVISILIIIPAKMAIDVTMKKLKKPEE